jgi:alpha-mannosidase
MTATIHLVGNAHLDPVWLWDWREGMNEALATCRAMVGLLREFPEFRFIRGEAAVYDYIERHAPALFDDIRALIKADRWDVVGGNWIQPDTNLPSTEALLRQFVRGKGWFREKFGVEVTAAWAADSFGHSAGLPDILAAAGMTGFAFTRPQANIMPLAKQAFWWRGNGASRILAFRPHDGWYASERAALGRRLDYCLEKASGEGLENTALFYGLGNHGGGPTRAHMRAIREWAEQHPEVRVVHSGLHRFFAALRAELAAKGEDYIPTHRGELNFCNRGCYASVARFKYAYRRGEARMLRAECINAAVAGGLDISLPRESPPLDEAWDILLFNAFHDILPGSAIERAYDDQLAQMGAVIHATDRAESSALLGLAGAIDTRDGAWPVPEDHPLPQPVLVWNPHPWEIRTQVEIEVSLDNRPLWQYKPGQDLPLVIMESATRSRLPWQAMPVEHDSLVDLVWRQRMIVPVSLPAMGWTLLQAGLDPLKSTGDGATGGGAKTVIYKSEDVRIVRDGGEAAAASASALYNGVLSVSAKVGDTAVRFCKGGRTWLADGLQVRLYEDSWGSWGGMKEERDSVLLQTELERWTISAVEALEHGPERGALWVRFAGKASRLDFILRLSRGESHVEIQALAFIDDRAARLKLIIPGLDAGGSAEFAVPGGTVRRNPCGEVPGGRWIRGGAGFEAVGFITDSLYGFDTTETELRATIVRTSRFGSDVRRAAEERPWQPCADMGEHRFRAVLCAGHDARELERAAALLNEPVIVRTVPGARGTLASGCAMLPPRGSALHLRQKELRLLSMRARPPCAVELRLQNFSEKEIAGVDAVWLGSPLQLGDMGAYEIITWRLGRNPDTSCWSATRLEMPI